MYLREIIINGFKSFPEKTVVKINSELTAVVGPNGSGKSNISDAFKWVMGEQSAKILRGSKMEDVIFAGTEKRKPLGFAEVNLIFDNTSKKLDSEYKDVCITRRLYRTGESEYLLNNASMKLKDIRELFMDTGIGIDGYSIIGQGRVEDIVSAKSETRRKVIEEAAGIVKYKTRKEETIKKLLKTEENIERINDIISEIEKRIEPLRKQKKSAENYLKYKEDLKKTEVNLFARDLEKQKEHSEYLNNHLESKNYELANKEKLIVKNQVEYENLVELVKNAEVEKSILEESLAELTDKFLEFKNIIKLDEEKRQLYDTERQKITNNIESFILKKIKLDDLKKEIKIDLINKENYLTLKNDELLEYESKQNNYLNDNSLFQEIIEQKKNDVFELYNLQSEVKNKINTLDSLISNYQDRINALNKDMEISNNSVSVISNNIWNNEKEIQEINKKAIIEKDEFNKIKLEYNSIILDENKSNRLIEIQVNKNNEYISKKNMLLRMQDSYEGYYKSVQQFMTDYNKKSIFKDEIVGVLAELIEIEKKYETALEISLGSAMQNIVIQSEKDASPIINYLKNNNIGRITFLPLDTIKGRFLNMSEKKALSMNGCIGVLSDLVKYNDKFENIISFLLGKVIVADNIENGIKIAKHINYSTKIVTLNGEIVNAGGSITGGSIKNNNFSLVSRKREIQELNNRILENNKNIEIEKTNNKRIGNSKKTIELKTQELNENIIALNNEIINQNATLKYKKEELSNVLSNKMKINEDISFLEEEKSKYFAQKNILIVQQDEVKNKIKSIEMELEEKNSNFKNSQDYLEDIRAKVTELKIKITNINNDIYNIENKITETDKEINNIEILITNEQKLENDISLKLEIIENEIIQYTEQENEIHLKITEKKENLKALNENKKEFQESLFENQKIINSKNKEINDIILEINSIKIKKEDTDNKIEIISNNLWDEYEMSYAMSCEYKDESISINKLIVEVRNLKKEIKLLGDVNINSIEEYIEVSERFDFLTNQRDDLELAKNKLNKVIIELSSKMKTQFDEEYNKIRKQFRNVFINLFDGGEADIVLSDEEDSLNSDIEIYVQPPGKKLNKISLLSGGEKALTAIALLFAILKTKPTPFCILDEIEAALDDANVHRFAKYLKEFSKDTQFLVITHRKGTMEYVDTLYGTNMEEQGVTKLVSMKLSKYNK